MAKKNNIELILSARDEGLTAVMRKGQTAVNAFTKEAGSGGRILDGMRGQVLQLVGAFAGFSAISQVSVMLAQADKNAYAFTASLKAANREFDVGSAGDWEATISRLSEKLKIYSESDLRGAASRTVDMTKRLGLSSDQMERMIELTGDLSAGRTTLEGGIERVTAALRGEAESSEFLGLTLNETYVTAWHEAHNAHNVAWKDLSDLEKAQVRYNVFLEQASAMQGRAAESTKTYSGAIALVRKEVADGIANNEDLVESLNEIGKALRENSGDLGKFAGDIASGAAKVITFVANNREMLIEVAKYGIAFGVAAKVVSLLAGTWRGLNAAMIVMTGLQIVPWLRALEARTLATGVALTVVQIGFVGIMGAVAAFFAAYKAGEWLAMHEQIAGIAAATKELEQNQKTLASQFVKISQSTGVTVTSMKELDQAVAENRIHYDDLTGTWKAGAKAQASATKESATAVKRVQGEALDAMKKKYKEYATEIKRLQDEIVGREKSLYDQLRAMARTGMTDVNAWKDLKRQAEEYEQKAKDAAAAGDWTAAIAAADSAKELYSQLNTEVKEGEQVLISQPEALKTAMDGVERAAGISIEAMKKQQEAAAKSMDDLVKDADFQDLSAGMDDAEKQWLKNWETMRVSAMKDIAAVEESIVALVSKDRTVYVNVKEVVQKATGGLIGGYNLGGMIQKLATGGGVRNILRGGSLGGYGGGDRRLLLGEDGEVMIRKESVLAAGTRAALAFNAGRWDIVVNELLKKIGGVNGYMTGGMLGMLPGIPRLAAGGMVNSGSTGETININLSLPGGGAPVRVQADRMNAAELLRQMQRMQRLAS